MVKFGVNFSRGVKNRGYLFPKMVPSEGPRPSKSLSRLSNPFPRPSKSSKSKAFQGLQTLLRETNPRVWGGQSAPRITFFLSKYQNRLRMSCKKWRLAFLLCQPNPSIRPILSILGYQCCADFCLPPWISSSPLRNFSSARINSPIDLRLPIGTIVSRGPLRNSGFW